MSFESTDPELLLFTMNPKYPPGSGDLIAKLVLRDPIVVDFIVTTVIGPEARSVYSPRPNEWSNGTKSDVIYAASVSSANFPPVLIEVQHTITPDFVDRLLGYSLCVKKEYKAKPIVIVFGVHATRNELASDFQSSSYPFMKQIPCKYWAEKCYMLDHSTIVEGAATSPLPPMMAIAYFFSCQKLSLLSTSYQEDPTLKLLYAIAKDQTGTVEQSATNVLVEVCDQTNMQFQKILSTLGPMPDTLLRKRLREYADDGILYTRTCKRLYTERPDMLEEPKSPSPELPKTAGQLLKKSAAIDMLRAEAAVPTTDIEYVQQYKKSMKTMDWKLCYDSGNSEGFFRSYNSSASVKSAFYKKKVNKKN